MTLQELKQKHENITAIEAAMLAKRKEIISFDSGKIKSITVRIFNNEDCTFEDVEVSKNLPIANVKGCILDHLKSQFKHLESKLERCLTPELQSVGNGI